MSSLKRIMVKEMAKINNGTAINIRGNVLGSINPLIEWIKWLSYVPSFTKERIDYIYSKNVRDLSVDELKELTFYQEERKMEELFLKYKNGKCSPDEYMEVYDYMGNSIKNVMLRKLTREELNYANEEIKRLNTLSKTEILTKLKNESSEETYNNLSMVDTYILHVVSDDFLQKSLFKRDKGLVAELDRNETIRQKSLYHATNSYCHKK